MSKTKEKERSSKANVESVASKVTKQLIVNQTNPKCVLNVARKGILHVTVWKRRKMSQKKWVCLLAWF